MCIRVIACCLLVITVAQAEEAPQISDIEFRFTRSIYNVSIPENSVAKTYAAPDPGEERIGIPIRQNSLSDIRYKIVSGDKDKFFKAEDKLVGDFCFLFIRTRTGNNDVLNRERKDRYLLEVRATATRKDGKQKVILETAAQVVVTVLDTNDLNPLFYPYDYNATVYEDMPVHKSILRVIAEDADLGRNGEIYYSFAEETYQFAIHPISGVISLSRPLRYNESTYHELTVIGQDRGAIFRSGSSMTSKAKVRIRVKKVNLYPPEILIRHHPQIVENSNADIYAIVNVSDRDSGIHGEIKSLEIIDGDPDGHFRIRPTQRKGEFNIEVLKLLDRESTPQGYWLKLRAVDRGVPPQESYKSVQVRLTDLNDNAPVFNKEIYEVKVPEIAPVNTPLIRLKVTDADEGKNAQVFLEIVGGNEGGEFNINPYTGMLYTAVQLDAETKSFYSLTVSAIDQGNAGTRKQSSAKVKIYVEDDDDNDPIFDKPEMTVWVDENMPAGSSVTTVHAKDKDRGENAYISYLIANLVKVPFEVDHFSGIVKTTALLDYESMRREYILRVRASDWGLPYRRQTEMQLTVRVKDVNDNRPQFEKIDCHGHIPRYVPIGSEIITLSAIDFDAGNIISYRIISGNEDGCFSIDTISGTITVTCDLNDVRVSERELNVTATDGTHFADVARVHFQLVNSKRNLPSAGRILNDETGSFDCKDTGVTRRLTEVLAAAENNNKPPAQEEFAMMPTRYGHNVHSPEFIDFPIEIKVNESVALGTTLIKLRAHDKDLGYNGKLIYGISGGDEHSVFCIDMDSGELKIIGYLDREREEQYNLNITVYDLGRPQKSLSRMLTITVLDVNDNAPKFEKSLANFRVTENALNGTAIFRANATDADDGDNAKVTYSLMTDTKDFVVGRTTGVLSVANALDRERQELYELRIRATDGGGRGPDNPPLYSEALVRILIDDINDNPPKFSLPSYTVKIREDIPKGSVVAVVSASDPDLGPEGEILYTLEDTDSDGTFKIDRVSGTIRTTKPLDFEERQVHSLIVFANDKGKPSLSSEASVTINIVDVNENLYAPQFGEFVISGSVAENQRVGSVVMQVNATDNDPPGEDSRIEYSIRGGDGIGIFSIDNKAGVIRTLSVLDFETKPHYWLTVFAQDHGVVPLYSSVEIYIKVLNENDNVPLSDEAVYYPSVPEESPAGRVVLQISATDRDRDPGQRITYKIVSGNQEGFFAINPSTGNITTTTRKLDRETQEEHILEVQISDNGNPPLSSTTRVVVRVEDINDNAPEFEQSFYKVQIPATASEGDDRHIFQNDAPDDFDGADAATDDDSWELFGPDDVAGLDRVLRVLAYDRDAGPNGEIQYSIKSGKGKTKFKIHNSTGMVFAQKGFEPGQEYELNVRATDGGGRSSICRVSVLVVDVPPKSKNPPIIKQPQSSEITEKDEIGFLVTLVQASDPDNDTLWYDIVDGDPRNEFYIGRDNGNILLAKQLDYETQKVYVLNISVTDMTHTAYTTMKVSVIDINDNRPRFLEPLYKVEISEAVAAGTEILKLIATDRDSGGKLFYSLHTARNLISLQIFKVDSLSGSVTLAESLDRETLDEHLLTVMVRDGATPAKRNYARILIIVHDQNDHTPQFSEKILVGKVFESAAVGSAVLRAFTVDHDKGENARVTYSITSGNVGNVFSIDPNLGVIQVARELDLATANEYTLYIKATDHGHPSHSSSVPAHIMLTMADNAPPRFVEKEIAAEIYEDRPLGSYVAHLNVRSTSSLQYEIVDGNTGDTFAISPSTGVIITQRLLDYELTKFYNLTIKVLNMASVSAECNVIVHILDKNDNAPEFLQAVYSGSISESAPVNSLILTNSSDPLVIKAVDADSEVNALLHYDIVEILPRQYFHIDANTGAIRSIRLLDHETVDKFSFHVQVSDLGKPKLSSETTARVDITITDVNDCPPKFSHSLYNVTLLLPTYKSVAVIQLNATDPDSRESTSLRYDIIDGNKLRIFGIDSRTGLITVLDPDNMKPMHKLQVRVSDGKFSNVAKVYIRVEQSENSGLIFQKPVYEGNIVENSTKPTTVCVVNVLGSALNEHLEFRILNPTNMFKVGLTSGVIQTTGLRFDRETKDNYELIIEARSQMPDREKPRVAHVIVNVTVMDINDNCPMFVNLPYYAVVSVDDKKGSIIHKVHAIDMDSAENGEVRYELIKGHGELFKVQRESGDIEIKQSLEGHNREYDLFIAAYDKGITPCRTEVKVHVKVIDRSMPIFKKQFYSESIPENFELHSPLALSVQAESPLGRKLIYSIVKGNELEEFALDFNTAPDSNNGPCVISVVDELDFEEQPHYELIVRATDSVSGVHAEVPVSVVLQDVNDCPPEFTQESYNISISEAAPFGTPILTVIANDNDTGINQKIIYSIKKDNGNSTELFHIDETEGTIYLKQSLDHETAKSHHFIVIATDQGVPSLNSTAHVWLQVLDMNDNPPKFEQPSYHCGLSVHAKRDQFVTIVSASDPDSVDQTKLRYTIVAGNEQQTFSMDPDTGVITLTNLANFGEQRAMLLNVSVSDGVYTNFARVKVELLPANLHTPIFPDVIMDVQILENKPPNTFVVEVKATDSDFGEFGAIHYSIHSDLLLESFNIDKVSGRITTRTRLDREAQKMYEIPVMASDGGDRSGFLTVRVKVMDENDNSPKFHLREYKGSIQSNYNIGTPFIRVRATDADEGRSAKLEYSIYDEKSSGVTDIFAIDANTGSINLVQKAGKYEGQVFQFFVRATDNGKPQRHSDVPVNILIMGPKDRPPIFERKDDKFFVSENSPTGNVITRLKLVSNVSVSYKIISGSEEDPEFAVDGQGQVSLARPLDFERRVSHLIGILAETDSSPPLTALDEITLQVLDENDHAPHFESTPYTLNLAENVNEGTSILKVIAHDEDQGSNGEVRYSFGSDSGEAINVFAVDAFTGWITTLVPLDKESKSEYKFNIIATDNGTPKHSARTTVIVRLKDYNDSPSVFKKKFYQSAVNEDALPGTVVLSLETTDADVDLNTPVEYYITAGDPSSQFQIRQTGEVYVVKPLDRETVSSYELDIIVTDGMFTDTTKVAITILDANDNPPYCLMYRYRQVLSEGIMPGSFVLNVLANDIDDQENSKLRYILTGDGSENFSLDKDTGYLKTVTNLDRENQNKYLLTAHVQDREHSEWECTSRIELMVSDLNDNAPQFSLPYYSVSLAEDVEVGTLVTKVHATDADIGINRKIKYAFLDSSNNHFKIESDSGIVTLAKPLDRELKAMYNLTVQVVDQGTPRLSTIASLVINVQDINDNPPEFASKYYFAVVPEISANGTEVVRVLATSKDTGVNADIYYSIIGGNEHKKFIINNRTGVIMIWDTLDYERAKDYFLTIQAIDGGSPPLSNIATVNITVTDSNDNAPIFAQNSYSARIREDAQIGDKILQIVATDLDSEENGRIEYSITKGDKHVQFSIDPDNGYISVGDYLDRESISTYVLEVVAKDHGVPSALSEQINVNIEISDANDNPPLFSQRNYTTIIQEDKPIGYPIIKFMITDADTAPNTSPYTFDFRSGNDGNIFRLEQDGVLRTATRFNHKIKDTYVLQIRVFDNGTPPLYSDTSVVVKVIEESQYPPIITPLEVNINSFLDEYPGGIIGKVHANDQDQYDTLTYSLSPTLGINYPTHELFKIDRTDGTLTALPRLDVGDYRLNVSVTDGKYYAHIIVKINVEIISDDMLENSIAIRFREVTPEAFVLSHRKGFVKAVRNAMNSKLRDVIIISVQPSNNDLMNLRAKRQVISRDLDVLFTVKKPDNGYYTADTLRKAMNDYLEELEESTKLVVEEIVRLKCTSSYCMYGVCQDHYILNINKIVPVSTEITSFVSAAHLQKLECICKEGYGGDRCDTIVNECAREPCPTYKICIPDASVQGYSCQCPEGYAGTTCDVDISKCHDESCYIARNPISFSGKSYSQYRIINKKSIEDQLSLSLRIRTMQPTGNLMYAAGKVDYNILEIVNGAVQYRFELGSGEGVVRISSIYISDGRWHEIRLERDRNSARITIDNIHTAQGSAPGISDILNLQSDEMYLGAEVHQHPSILGFEDIQRGFSGCMDDVRISRVSVPLHKSGDSSVAVLKRFANVEFSCDASTVLTPLGACGSQPCMNGGTCKEIIGGFECQCHERYKGTLCELDTDPCASAPCLYGGKCTATIGGDYTCDCIFRMTGKRCEYGRYCAPNPCKNGGVCEEGDEGPLCKCRAFTGEFCEFDLDECLSSPCLNGGKCVNNIGSFHCICPQNTSGSYCGNPLYSTKIISNTFNITLEELIGIIAVVVSILIIVFCFILCLRCRNRRSRRSANMINNETRKENQIVLNSNRNHELIELKRGSKLSNLEVNQREIPPARPLSYGSANEQHNNMVLNNLDTLRSYGSAGDELENMPPAYGKNLNRSSQQSGLGNHCDSEKTTWADQMHLASTLNEKAKIKNDFKTSPVNCDPPNRLYGGRSNTIATHKHINGPTNIPEDDQRSVGNFAGYHWDCSDWARHSQTLPNITEVPGSEIPDSSSFHSNESNESRSHHLALNHMDTRRDIGTLNEDIESEFMADSECENAASPNLNALDSGNEEFRFTTAENYLRHPNTYLPTHGFNIPSEAEGDSLHSPGADSDDVEPYGFPSNRNRLKNCDDDLESIITTLEERHSLLGGYGSNSDMSTNLCEIEDSECENEHKPLNYLGGVQQTSV
ncbi:PREDICTED: fat-like cadherin-related tumor suppressor homolog isoform X4 [Nicrophorus vespilloides]|uniref:Fat-like cadherin-related tumor suppressor homolog isoform X4 n=1 Tax=Nicrophorus vespilloides TaxID=110193 RepID=A0ABM1M4G8_NICVS|nr:PREDICTED: fat-like cadherin-related tumor suppressor homolog isoform X4 [Nicrophorus vespilloides]